MAVRWHLEHLNLSPFEPEVRQLVHDLMVAGREGLEREGGSMDRIASDKKALRRFIKLCHRGYMRGQDRLIELLLEIERQRRGLEGEGSVDDVAERAAQRDLLKVLGNREKVLRSLADHLVLALYKQETWAIRRLIHSLDTPAIHEPAVRSAQRYAHHVHERNPLCFALITDLTSCIGIFDVLQIDFKKGGEPVGIELKEGEVNERILDVMSEPDDQKLAAFYADHGESGLEQVERILRQQERALATVEAIEKDYGTDVLTGQSWVTSGEVLEVDDWAGALDAVITEARETGLGARLFDDCLYVICYTPSAEINELAVALSLYNAVEPDLEFPLSVAEKGQVIGKDLLQARLRYFDDLRSGLKYGDCAAPWVLPADPETLLDIVFGRLVVRMYLDPEGFQRLADKRGVTVRWATRKERAVYAQERREAKPLEFPQGSLVAEVGDVKIFVGPGTWLRVLFNYMAPHSAVDSFPFGAESMRGNMERALTEEESRTLGVQE